MLPNLKGCAGVSYHNKIAFQKDSYRPRVGRIYQHALHVGGGGFMVPGWVGWVHGLWGRDAWTQGCVHGPGGCAWSRGVVVSQHALRHTPLP